LLNECLVHGHDIAKATGRPWPIQRHHALLAMEAFVLPLIAALPPQRVIDLVGKVDLLTAAAVLRRSALFIGNDTGLMHLAAPAGVPTLGLFGPSPIELYAPWGPHTATVATATAFRDLFGPDFDRFTTDTLMDSLSVDAAEDGARRLWARASGQAA
jgi:ADP-heptose:LPS heptosyltransferase